MPDTSEAINIDGSNVIVRRLVGEVLHSDRNFETHIAGSGGGGWVGPNGGYVSDAQVTSHATQHQKVFIRTDSGSEEAFDFSNWNLSVRPGSRLAMITCLESGGSVQSVLATRNLDTGEEKWLDVRQWAQKKGLLSGMMRVWPSALIALVLGGAFTLFATYARTRAGATSYNFSDFLLACAIAFVPAVVIEWLFVIILQGGAAEAQRIHGLLADYLRTGVSPA